MSKRVWGIIIVIASLAIIAGIIYIIFFYKFNNIEKQPIIEQPVVEQPVNNLNPTSNQQVATNTTTVQVVSPLKKAEINKDDLIRMASAFAERFGSYSNQSDYGNIRDLQIFMTNSMKDWADDYINQSRVNKTQTSIYYGIVTKAISGEAKQFDSDVGKAEILVKTQRRESSGTSGNSITFYQNILIKYIREQGVWRVDGIEWQTK